MVVQEQTGVIFSEEITTLSLFPSTHEMLVALGRSGAPSPKQEMQLQNAAPLRFSWCRQCKFPEGQGRHWNNVRKN